MKKLRYLFIIPALILGACNKPASSAESDSSLDTSSSESIVSVSSDLSSNSSDVSSSSSSSSLPEENPQIANSEWGKEAAQACFDAIGEVVPYMAANAFEYKVDTDDYGDPSIWFYLYYDSQEAAEAKIVDYAYVAWEKGNYECVVKSTWLSDGQGSMWEQKILYADKVLDDEHAIEIMALDSLKSYNGVLTGCLGLFCYTYVPNPDNTKFPTNAVNNLLGKDNTVPSADANGGKFSFTFSVYEDMKILQILVTECGIGEEIECDYFYALLTNGYQLRQWDDIAESFTHYAFKDGDIYPDFDDNLCYYAYSPDDTHIIYFDYDYMNQQFIIEIMVPTVAAQE